MPRGRPLLARELAKKYKISPVVSFATVQRRMDKLGLAFIDAAKTPASKVIKPSIAYRYACSKTKPVVSLDQVRTRMRKWGWSFEKAMTTPRKRNAKPCGQGVITKCRKYGITPAASTTTITQRLKRGWSFIDAATTPSTRKYDPNSKQMKYLRRSKLFKTEVAKLLAEMGLIDATEKQIMDAIQLLLPSATIRGLGLKKKYTVEQEQNFKKAEKQGIPRNTVKARLRKGWTFEKAVSTPVNDGVLLRCEQYGIVPTVSETHIRARIKKGMSLLEAATTPPAKPPRGGKKAIQFIRKYNLNPVMTYSAICRRMRRGWPFFLAANVFPYGKTDKKHFVSISHWGVFELKGFKPV